MTVSIPLLIGVAITLVEKEPLVNLVVEEDKMVNMVVMAFGITKNLGVNSLKVLSYSAIMLL